MHYQNQVLCYKKFKDQPLDNFSCISQNLGLFQKQKEDLQLSLNKVDLNLEECKNICFASFSEDDSERCESCVADCNVIWKKEFISSNKLFFDHHLKGNREKRKLPELKF